MWKKVHCSDETLGGLFIRICIGICSVQHLEHIFLTVKYDGRNIMGCSTSAETKEMVPTTVVGSWIESKYRSALTENVLVSKRLETEVT